jgi:hypothetical protein
MTEVVRVLALCQARPQLIAPHGRWSFAIVGKDWELKPMSFNCAYSPRGALAAGRRMCKRLGFTVQGVDVEEVK